MAVLHAGAQLQLGSGTTLRSNSNVYIVLDNIGLISNGTVSQVAGEGYIKFTGASDVALSGNSAVTIDKLLMAKTGTARLNLQRNINIVSQVAFTSGLLNLNNNIIDLGASGSVQGETESAKVYTNGTGYVQSTVVLNAPSSVNPGGLGAIITSSANLGSTIVRRGHRSQVNTYGNGNSILRYYEISPANNTGLNATLRLHYLDAELNALDENSLTLWKSPNGTQWSNMGFTARNTTLNYVERSGLSGFSFWTLSSPFNALRVIYTLINTRCVSGQVRISWNTAQEEGFDHFNILRTADGRTWQSVGKVRAAGGPGQHSYTLMDSYAGNAQYRIMTVDINGRELYSKIILSDCGGKRGVEVFPNPVKDIATVSLSLDAEARVAIKVYDMESRLVRSQQVGVSAGVTQLQLDMKGLGAGSYVLVAEWGNERNVVKVVKE